MANVYKSFNWKTDVQQSAVTESSTAKKNAANTILSNFITYFKAKHT